MNPFLLHSADRLSAWRTFRSDIKDMSDLDQLLKVAVWWAQAPTVTYVIDWDAPDTWPTPWELLSEGHLCTTAIAYLMEQTLLMVGWAPDRLRLKYIRHLEEQEQRMVLVIDDQWILNYSLAELFNFDNIRSGCALLAQYKATEDGHEPA